LRASRPLSEGRVMDERVRAALRRTAWKEQDREHDAIDWSTPNEQNGYWDKGTEGSLWWVDQRKKSAVDVTVGHLLAHDVPSYMPTPRKNPLPGHLTDEQWREVRRRVHDYHVSQAKGLLEEAYRYGRFGQGKDLETARDNAEWERLEEYIVAARDAALIFHRLGEVLKRERERRADNVKTMGRETQHG
jgi:hypothetical protein